VTAVKKVILSGNKPPNAAVANYLHEYWLERKKAPWLIEDAVDAARVLFQLAGYDRDKAHKILTAVADEHLPKRQRAISKEIAVLVMASKFRQNASSDRKAIIQAINLYYGKPKDWQNKLRKVQYRLGALHKDGFIPSATVGAFAEWEWQMRDLR
jgi:hypothetical protein